MSLSIEPAANEMYVVAKSAVRRRKEEAMSLSRRVLVARRRVDAEQRGAYHIYTYWCEVHCTMDYRTDASGRATTAG